MDLYEGVNLKDPWKELRKNLFRNVEPNVELIAITQPLEKLSKQGIESGTIAAYTARHCWESSHKYSENPKENNELDKELTKNLIKMGHDTPLQAINYVFDIEGVTKSLQAQWTRHKIGVGWSFRSSRFVSGSSNTFVYNTYDYIEDEEKVKKLLELDEQTNKQAITVFDEKIKLGATKQDARKVMPVQFATHCSFFANARSIRHLLKLRLDKHAEWEIRRMSVMILEELMKINPEIYQDIYDKYTKK